MHRTPSNRWRTGLAAGALCLAGTAQAFDDGQGKEWRTLTATQGAIYRLSHAQVAEACPTDGMRACSGRLGGVAMKDWVWATAPQVATLFGQFAPGFSLQGAQLGGAELVPAVVRFKGLFGITAQFKGCPTYQPCFNVSYSTGLTASLASSGAPYAGEAIHDMEWGSGHLRLFSPPHPDLGIGLWMWRPTGHGTADVYANDDEATVGAPGAGTAIANVLANDWVAGQRASLAQVQLTQLSTSPAIWLAREDGSVRVAAGALAGTYTIDYRLCNAADSARCDDAQVSVTIPSFALVANPDRAAFSMGKGGRAIADVLANDTVGGVRATLATVRLTQVSSTHAGVTLNAATGSVEVAPGTPSGTHVLTYRICEIANPANCVQSTATVAPYTLQAVADTARGSSKTGGVVIASVLANDWFNGARATTAQVQISLPAPLPAGFRLDTGTGAVTVAPKVDSGTYRFDYRLCEIASPDNCATAAVTVDLSGRER